jgi:serine/threonine-protein kinase SBK
LFFFFIQVHRDVKPENVIIFDADFHKVKLIDFGMTRKCGSYVRRLIGSIPYSPPEVCDAVNNDILVSTAMDVWAFGVLLFCCLTGNKRMFIYHKKKEQMNFFLGNFPWEHAHEYIQWLRHHQLQRRYKLPSQWYRFSNRLMRLFRKMLGN